MRGVGFEPTDSLRDRISYLQISAFLSPARLTRLRYPLAKGKIDDLFKDRSIFLYPRDPKINGIPRPRE